MSIAREKIQMHRLPSTPGEMLLHEFMLPNEMSARALARDLGVPPNRITGIINGKRAMTADTAALFEKRLGMPGEFWMNLQSNYDFAVARQRNAKAA
ncbi:MULTISPECIES: HigA family addiction module antitoxin [unclassified Tardiphaga]|uniref:HigA family addiction module antitoxin n=1 Tax=unclassified Tardiphaga TaxID=2631404 RepID=UPI001FEFDF5C|nr:MULTISPECIES: HigA family addiction module antitoxin [unclassified Tardiphaga]